MGWATVSTVPFAQLTFAEAKNKQSLHCPRLTAAFLPSPSDERTWIVTPSKPLFAVDEAAWGGAATLDARDGGGGDGGGRGFRDEDDAYLLGKLGIRAGLGKWKVHSIAVLRKRPEVLPSGGVQIRNALVRAHGGDYPFNRVLILAVPCICFGPLAIALAQLLKSLMTPCSLMFS